MAQNFSVSRSGRSVTISRDLELEFITFDEQFEYDQKRIDANRAIPSIISRAHELRHPDGKSVTYIMAQDWEAANLYCLFCVLLPKVVV
jgi:hypothetical protein